MPSTSWGCIPEASGAIGSNPDPLWSALVVSARSASRKLGADGGEHARMPADRLGDALPPDMPAASTQPVRPEVSSSEPAPGVATELRH